MSQLRVAIIAPPWLTIPPLGYGGIEEVLDALLAGLVKNGVLVELFTIGGTKAPKGVKVHSLYKTEQYDHVHKPMYESLPILCAHLQFSINKIIELGNFDVIHGHNGFLGPQLFAMATRGVGSLPPTVHTLHGPPFSNQTMIDQGIPDNKIFWNQLGENMGRLYLVGISDALMTPAPKNLRSHILPTVYNAVDVTHFPFVADKKAYFITLARFSKEKGQHVAARLCVALGFRLRMAGTIAGISTNRRLLLELANPISAYRNMDDFRYYSDNLLSITIRNRKITYVGNITGKRKLSFIANAKALLFPIDWEEPFGMAVIEALACGTPVIAMNRGAMPEIIRHGYNGFLANDEKEFGEYMQRIDEIDPANCRESVEATFSADLMAKNYIERYKEAIRLSKKAKS